MNSPRDDSRSDLELIDAANAGERDAFETLYLRHREWVVNLSFRFLHDREGALDVMQETFIHLLGKFPGFELRANLKTYLYPVVRNIALTHHRKIARQEAVTRRHAETQPSATPGTDEASPHLDDLATVMSTLTPGQREVVLLRFMDDLSLAEIAEAIGLPLGTVKSRLHNALRTLRRDERTQNYFLE